MADYYDPLAASAGVAPPGPTPYGSAVLSSLVNLGLAPGRIAQGQRLENVGQYSDLDEAQRQVNLDALMKGAPAIALTMLGTGPTFAAEGALGAAGGKGIRAYHGSPYDFERFDMSKIGSGEGAQAYGHGLYFAENPGVAQQYRETLGRGDKITVGGQPMTKMSGDYYDQRALQWLQAAARDSSVEGNFVDAAIAKAQADLEFHKGSRGGAQSATSAQKTLDRLQEFKQSGVEIANPGKTYEVQINAEPEHFLDWDKPISELPAPAQQALKPYYSEFAAARKINPSLPKPTIAGELIAAANYADKAPELSASLREAGIPGIKYLDQGSRGAQKTEGVTLGTQQEAELQAQKFRDAGYRNVEIMPIYGDPADPHKVAGYRAMGTTPGTSNYVLFRDDIIDILRKYGIAAPVAGALAEQMGAPERPAQAQ